MICEPCKAQDHSSCPSQKPFDDPKTGLSTEGDKIQRSGLCPCQHKVKAKPVLTDIGTEFVAQIDAAGEALDALATVE